jgi:BASS family bile acid:Na+ symporter
VSLEQLIGILVTVTLIEMMIAVGLSVRLADLAAVFQNKGLLVRALVANYVVVPAVTVGMLVVFETSPLVTAGFLILAVCPGAPYGPPFTAVARGEVSTSVGLMIVLAASSAVCAPLLLQFLLPLVSGESGLQFDAKRIAATLFLTQLLPLAAGLAARQCWPAIAARLLVPAQIVSKILNLLTLCLILAANFPDLLKIRLVGYAGMLLLLIASLSVGWLLGGRSCRVRRAFTVTTALRNVGVGLVIATSSFPGTPAVIAVVAYGVVSLMGVLGWSIAVASTGRDEHAIAET